MQPHAKVSGAGLSAQLGTCLVTIKSAELVAVRITHVCQIHRAQATWARARRVLNGGAAICNGCVVKRMHLLRGSARKADGSAIRGSGWLIVDWLDNAEGVAIVTVEESRMAGLILVAKRFCGA
ncbi:MAG: hypothetical protein A3G29_06570 [Burkholderiales bacterium RIFCSPLOWO2_12_FULL_64_99]|nr:MAG: hypothetical protein A3G29_06570 [Burkholderiales bacterium RIFCSPLOWO2_12_FULL_64_99]